MGSIDNDGDASILCLNALNFVSSSFPRDAYRAGVLNLCRATRGEQFLVSALATRIPEVLLGAAAVGDVGRVRFILDNVGNRRAAVAVACGSRWSGITPLAVAAACGHAEVVRFLIAEGASVNAPSGDYIVDEEGNRSKFPILHWASHLRSYEGEEPLGPLHLAVSFNHDGIVNLLLDAGASIEQIDSRSERCPLHYAVDAKKAQRQNPRILQLLLARGADANNNNTENPPDLLCSSHGWRDEDFECVRLLVDAGAHIDSLADGLTPLGRILSNYCGILEGADVENELAIHAGYAKTGLFLISRGGTAELDLHEIGLLIKQIKGRDENVERLHAWLVAEAARLREELSEGG